MSLPHYPRERDPNIHRMEGHMGIREEAFYFAVKVYFTSTFLVKVEVIVIHVLYFVLVSMSLTV
jgi:hypothetical protein